MVILRYMLGILIDKGINEPKGAGTLEDNQATYLIATILSPLSIPFIIGLKLNRIKPNH